jgi:hypothetical protein
MAWYEHTEPSYDEVFDVVNKNLNKTTTINIDGKYDEILKQSIDIEYAKYNSFGSWRGFYTFTLSSIMKIVREKLLEEIKKKVARRTIANSTIMKLWVNHILYRLPDKETGEKRGVRVDKCEDHFNKLQQQQQQQQQEKQQQPNSDVKKEGGLYYDSDGHSYMVCGDCERVWDGLAQCMCDESRL